MHQNDVSDTARRSLRNAQGIRQKVEITIHVVGVKLDGNANDIKSPQSTMYRMHVMSSSINCAVWCWIEVLIDNNDSKNYTNSFF